jgi:outer membrane protein TolC
VAGLGDQIALLDAQRAWQQAQAQQQQLQAQQLQAAVAVFRAFGGGWQVPQQGAP